MNISMIAVERLLSIRLPLYYRRLCSSKRVLVAIAAAWFLVYLSGILLIYLQNYGVSILMRLVFLNIVLLFLHQIILLCD